MQMAVPAALLIPGNTIHLVMGQKVPADVKLIDVSGDLMFDRSVLTREVRVMIRRTHAVFYFFRTASFSLTIFRCPL